MIVKYSNIRNELDEMREVGNPRGSDTGFKCLDELYSIKMGSYTFVLASPHHGKSEFCFELIFNQAEKKGIKSMVYSPETGSVADIYAEFIHKYIGKPFYKSIPGSISESEYAQALNWIDHHFSIVDADEKSYSFQEITKMVTDEKIILMDPYNEMSHDMSKYFGRQDLYIEDLCGEIRRYCKKQKKHCILTLHPASQQLNVESKIKYYPMPKAREAAGGQALFRKAMTWINMWRPADGLFDQNGQPYQKNQVLISIEKAKPKGSSTKGDTTLFFDWKRNRYYEEINQRKRYAYEHEKGENVVMPIDLNIRGTEFEEEDLF